MNEEWNEVKHLHWNGSDFQKANCLDLADHLDSLPDDYEHFEMDYFHTNLDAAIPSTQNDKSFECGSCGCAIGHGPSIGIHAREQESWHGYAHRAFVGGSPFGTSWRNNEHALWFEYAFGPDWPSNPKDTAARIRLMVNQKIKLETAVAETNVQ